MKKRSGSSFITILFLAYMVYIRVSSGAFSDPKQWLINTLLILPGIVIGITLHEFAHAFSAWKLGDQTPKLQGRVTVNPLAHIDPIGIITLVFAGFGWGRPVQVNPYAFGKRRMRSNIIVDVAGVVTNFIIAFLCTSLLFFIQNNIVYEIVANIVYINLALMFFNLLPVPPLDGFGIITEIFNLRRFSWYPTLYNVGPILLLVLIIVGAVGLLLGSALGAVFSGFTKFWYAILV